MNFRIADTFTDALARLSGQEQKAVKTTAFDLQMNPAHPGFAFHRLSGRDPNFWSVRAGRDIRLIVHKDGEDVLLAYVDHHDDAYRWAERRKLEVHPATGAMQLVEVREVAEAPPPAPPPDVAAAPEPIFGNLRKAELMAFGVPAGWVDPVREATEATLFDVLAHLPQEAAEALLKLAVGERPTPPPTPAADPYDHPDAERRYRLLTSHEELARALEEPWEKWAVFLHPDQNRTVKRDFAGPARVSGSAGTGKTIVALHRAVHLARSGEGRVLLTTFSKPLADALGAKLATLAGTEPAVMAAVTVQPLHEAVRDLYSAAFGVPAIADDETVETVLLAAARNAGSTLPARFLNAEWTDVVDAWQIVDVEGYRDVPRLGRRTRLGAKQREALWSVFQSVREELARRGVLTWAQVFARVTEQIVSSGERPFRFAVVDEAQDLGVPELRFLAALADDRPNALFFTGDLGQRIFRQPFSWRTLGVDVRGRSQTLKVNYRTSHQIRLHADRLLPQEIADIDQVAEQRRGTISIFDGPVPEVRTFATRRAECDAIAGWVRRRIEAGIAAAEIALFVRSDAELPRAHTAASSAGVAADASGAEDRVRIGTMHAAKGLEFRAVAVLACDDDIIPLQARVAAIADENDLEEIYSTERYLLYVACTRAREALWVSGVKPASEFLSEWEAS